MADELRDARDFFGGILDQPVSAQDTKLTSTAFAALPTDYSAQTPGKYLPLTLINGAKDLYEIVWVTGHSSGAQEVQVKRGREGTTAQLWDAGMPFECASTRRDMRPVDAGGLPADAHVGFLGVDATSYLPALKTRNQGFRSPVGFSPSLVGTALDGTTMPPAQGHLLLVSAWRATVRTNSSGKAAVAIPSGGFPNKLVSANANRFGLNAAVYNPTVLTESTAATVWIIASTEAAGPLANTDIMLSMSAFGY